MLIVINRAHVSTVYACKNMYNYVNQECKKYQQWSLHVVLNAWRSKRKSIISETTG
jgi:hypothetical protein